MMEFTIFWDLLKYVRSNPTCEAWTLRSHTKHTRMIGGTKFFYLIENEIGDEPLASAETLRRRSNYVIRHDGQHVMVVETQSGVTTCQHCFTEHIGYCQSDPEVNAPINERWIDIERLFIYPESAGEDLEQITKNLNRSLKTFPLPRPPMKLERISEAEHITPIERLVCRHQNIDLKKKLFETIEELTPEVEERISEAIQKINERHDQEIFDLITDALADEE